MTSRTLVVTGVNGFVGAHVARLAAEAGWSVRGYSLADRPSPRVADYLDEFHGIDLRAGWRPVPMDADIIHLAGLAAVGPSFSAPQTYLEVNSAMVTHMCESLLATGWSGRLICISSGAVYASGAAEAVHAEDAPLGYTSPYVISKLLVENQIRYYRNRGIDGVIARPFNHIGPGQGRGFLVPDLTVSLRSLPAGEELVVGNLATRRDYTDVRDVARAYLDLLQAPALDFDMYNVASGTPRSGEEVLGAICRALGREIPSLMLDPSRRRPGDPPSIAGDAARIRRELGWAPTYSFEQTVADAVAD